MATILKYALRETQDMLSSFVWILTFSWSFLAYSGLRYLDQVSTKLVAERVDIQRHEVNPLITRLAKKLGLDNAFRITWLSFASIIAVTDSSLNTVASFGVPAVALLFGTAHLLAAAHNFELYYQMKDSTKEQIERETFMFAQKLSLLSWRGRLSLLAEKYAFTFVVGLFSLLIFVSFFYGDAIGKLTGLRNAGPAMSNAALFELTGLLLFFPALFLGTVLWSRGLLRSYLRGEIVLPSSKMETATIQISVAVLEDAISAAKANHSQTIRIEVKSDAIEGVRSHLEKLIAS